MERTTAGRVLFVDDDRNILHGLRRMLSPMRDRYDFEFVGGGSEALELMDRGPRVDVIVTDMRMPTMDGAELLTAVAERHADTVRIVLSGQSDKEVLLHAVGLAHQYLTKPCDAQTLRSVVMRACELSGLLSSPDLRRLVAGLRTLPSLPSVYTELQHQLQSPTSSVRDVGAVIAQDVAMTAKVLQLINSALFGLSRQITSPVEATVLLGLDTIRALILSAHIFAQYDGVRFPGFTLEGLRDHSLRTAAYAGAIAAAEGAGREERSYAVLAGLLHDVGRLLLAANLPREYAGALAAAREQGCQAWEAEQQAFSATHADVGAYLLALWGIECRVVEAARHHHHPSASLDSSFTSLTAVHAGNVIALEQEQGSDQGARATFDREYMRRLGLSARIPAWRAECERIGEVTRAA